MIKRYTIHRVNPDDGGPFSMFKYQWRDAGNTKDSSYCPVWVRYSDHIAEMDRLTAEYESIIASLKTEIDILKAEKFSRPCGGILDAQKNAATINFCGNRILNLEKENEKLKQESNDLKNRMSRAKKSIGIIDFLFDGVE